MPTAEISTEPRTAARPPLPRTEHLSPAALARIAEVLATRETLWRPVIRFRHESRWFARVAGGEGWEAWLLTWLPDQGTGLHGHGPSSGAYTVIRGRLSEAEAVEPPVTGRLVRLRRHEVDSGGGRAFAAGYVHDVANPGPDRAVSLHVYAPALTSMTRYTVDETGILRGSADERAGVDW